MGGFSRNPERWFGAEIQDSLLEPDHLAVAGSEDCLCMMSWGDFVSA
ncbi:MAG: hypothetical protein LBR80_07480 [Deltaproteobacteria bacterium]|jgi:hypothetical protein|nr:hypothetical protein [Deltaproteobacteria bacterium]